MIGDCQTAALVNRNGSIDWLCLPAFDSDACFAALLGDESHGHWQIAPAGEIKHIQRRYRGHSLVLETLFETEEGTVTLIDFMPPSSAACDIVRIVRGETGRVSMRMKLALRFGFGIDIPWVKRAHDGSLEAICGPDKVVLHTPVKTRGQDMTTVADFEINAGEMIPFVLTYAPSHLPVPVLRDVHQALSETEHFWFAWSARCTYTGPRRELVLRSLITLKALTYGPSGGIIAAPTTSLPEKLRGSRNWDYRFCWLRDATFTLLALMDSGYTEEALDWHGWLLRAVAGAPADMQIMYGILGHRRLLEWEATWLPGYDGAKPVRIGNAAHVQLQLDVYGELIDACHQSRVAQLKLGAETWDIEQVVLDHLAKVWTLPDSGIWERRGSSQHYVFSKVMCWVAFDRGVKSAEMFGFPAPLDRWRALRDEIHEDVCRNGFNAEHNAFMEFYGAQTLDASVLLLPAVGFLPASDPRIEGTIRAVEKHLMRDGFVLRHDPREATAETHPIEGAFLACSLWLADACVLAGELDKAQELFDRVVDVANDVGLLSEEYDSVARRQTGNFPQALTHIAIIITAQNIFRARKPVQQRAR